MMEIISYKKLRGNLYEVSFDNGDDLELYDDIILKYELLIDKKLDQKKLEKVILENAELEAYYKAIKYIGVKMRTELEVRKYLKKYDLPNSAIKKTIDKLKKDGYLDQRKYTEAYVNDSVNLSLNGPRKIKSELVKRGISEEYADEFLSKVENDVWQSKVKKILDKKSKTNKMGTNLFKNKSYQDLSIMGYYGEDIRAILEGYNVDMSSVFEREADKVYNKLSSKYEGVELELRFKSKMYAKGFDGDMISDYLGKK